MSDYEVVARSREQAREKIAAKHGVAIAELEVAAEFEPDEIDIKALEAEESENPSLRIEGEPVLFQLKAGMNPYIERARTVAHNILECMAEDSRVECVAFGHGLLVRVEAPDPSFLIGKGGASLDALQHVVSRCCNSKDESFPDIIVDVGGYREKRLLRLGHDASESAHRAMDTKRSIALEPMNPIERKYIHNMLKKIPGIITKSEGFEPARYIVVSVPDAEEGIPPPPGKAHGRRGRRGRHGDRGDRGERRNEGGQNPRAADSAPRHEPRQHQQRQGPPSEPVERQHRDPREPRDFDRNRHQGRGGNRGNNAGGGGGNFADRGNREERFTNQPPPPDHSQGKTSGYIRSGPGQGGKGGGYRGRGGNNRGGPQRSADGRMRGNEQFDPTRHIDYAGLPKITPEEEEAAYRDVQIEGRQSRLPVYRPQDLPADYNDPNRKMVDELE